MGSLLSPLDDVLKRSGAHMTEREGWVVAADFGSLASEIAVSRATAGLADVSSISKFEVRDTATAIADMYPSGRELRPGRAIEAADAWWCVVSEELLLVLASPSKAARVRADLDQSGPVGDADRGRHLRSRRGLPHRPLRARGPVASREPLPARPAACGLNRWAGSRRSCCTNSRSNGCWWPPRRRPATSGMP